MKKSFFLIPTLLFSMIAGLSLSSGNNVLVARADSEDYVDLGKTINLSSASEFSAEYLLEKGILNESFKENVSPVSTNLFSQDYSESSSYQAETFSNSLSATMSTNIGLSIPVECAMFDIGFEFGASMSVDYHSFQNQFFYRREYQVKKNKLEIPMYSTYLQNETTYSANYLSQLNQVLTNQITPAQFFDTYGTHLLVGGIYGGMYTSDYTLLTNQFAINSTKAATMKTAVSASLVDTSISAEAGFTESVLSISGNSSASVVTSYHAYAVGGNYSIASGPQDCPENMASWYNTVYSYSALILPSFEGLIPLSSAIPSTYSSSFKQTMANALTSYLAQNSHDFSAFAPLDGIDAVKINNFVSDLPTRTVIRYSEYTIEDHDPYDTDNDYVSIFQNNTLTTGFLYYKGFRFLSFKITLSMKEIDPGYQEILVYDGYDNLLWSKTDIELGGGNLQGTFVTNTYYANNIPLIPSSSHYLYVRYGAHGNAEDNWVNKNLRLDLLYTRNCLSEPNAIDSYTTYWR